MDATPRIGPPAPMGFDTDAARAARPIAWREIEMIGEKDKSGNYVVDLSWLRRGIDAARRAEEKN
jgi:hypothetical protein